GRGVVGGGGGAARRGRRGAKGGLGREGGLRRGAELGDAVRPAARGGDRCADRACLFVVGLRRRLLRRRRLAALLALELRAETGAESLLRRAGHQKLNTFDRLMIAGPSTTLNIA